MSMRDAIAISNVPVYQNLAQRIGLKNYQEWLAKLDYGNRKTGNIIDRFWLDGPLLISAVEQVQFLEKLISKDLAVSAKTQQSVMEIIRLESSDSQTLFGKTGWTQAGKPALGWFVGWVKTLDEHYSFALNMDIVTPSDAKKRKPVTKQLLKNLGVYSTSQSKH